MKIKITLTLVAAISAFAFRAQVLLSEDFTSPFNPTLAGWTIINNSIPSNTMSWTQGNGTGGNVTFPAYNGSTNDFYCTDFQSVPAGSGGISAWLISPLVSIYNGAVLQFATRTASVTPVFPDRLQIRMSQTPLTAIPAGSASVGGFSTLLLDINPNLTTNTSSVVSNGIVNGYPQTWSVYTLQISGVTGTVSGRFAFRYYVDDAGSTGTNSRMIGLDAVKYTLPCGPSVNSYTVCAGNSVTLVATGGLPATTYQWSSGGTSNTEIVTPTIATVYTLTPGNGTMACGTQITSTVTIGSQLSMDISASTQTVCTGRSVTLTATSAAASYSWSNGGNLFVKIINPTSSAIYTVVGVNGNCFGSNTISIVVIANPALSYVIPYTRCPATTMSIMAFGAINYTWTLGAIVATTNPISVLNPGNTSGGSYTLGLKGINLNGCVANSILNIPYSPNPVLAVAAVGTVQCTNNTTTLTANGAHTYTWTGDASSNSGSVTINNGTSASVKNFSIAGTSTATGCSANTTYSYAVSLCTSIHTINGEAVRGTVFPNPFSNELHLSNLSGYIEVYNSLGQLVISKSISANEWMDTSELAKGAYVLKATTDNSDTRIIRLLKN